MTPVDFFVGKLSGFGVVRSGGGKILRRYSLEMHGEWSAEHRALHLDETYHYMGGGERRRKWAIHTDEEGYILGHDAIEAARLRGHQRGRDFRIVFDRPRGRADRRIDPPQVADFIEVGPNDCLMLGRTRFMGVTLTRLSGVLQRHADVGAPNRPLPFRAE